MPRGSLSCPSLGYNSGLRDEYVDDIFARKQTFWGATSKIAGEVLNRIKVARRQATASPIVSARQRNHMPERHDGEDLAILSYIAGQTAFLVQAVAVMSVFVTIHIIRLAVLSIYSLVLSLVQLLRVMVVSSNKMKNSSTDLSSSASSWWSESSPRPQKIFRLGAWDDENEEEDSFEL